MSGSKSLQIFTTIIISKDASFDGKRPEILAILYLRAAWQMLFTNTMPATLTREEMRLYQRERRARIKAENKAGGTAKGHARQQSTVLDRQRTAEEKMWDAQLEAIDARGGRAQWTGNGYRDTSSALSPQAVAPTPRTADRHEYTPAAPPQSMIAVGGRPTDNSGFGSVATQTAAFRNNVTASLNRLAEEAVQAKREREAQDRRIAALEAKTNRLAVGGDIMQAIASLLSFTVSRAS